MLSILTLIRCMHSKVSEGQLFRVLCAHHLQKPAMAQCCTDCHGSGLQPCGTELQIFLWHFLALTLNLLEKRGYQQRAAVMCSHQVLRGGRVNPKEAWWEHILLSLGFKKMESATAARGQKALRGYVCGCKEMLFYQIRTKYGKAAQ